MKRTFIILLLLLLIALLCACKNDTNDSKTADKSTNDLHTNEYNSSVITVYLEDGINPNSARYVGKDIEKLPNVSYVEFVSKEEALEEFREAFSSEQFEEILKDNPLPDAYKVYIEDLSLYDVTLTAIKKIEGVDEVTIRPDKF